MDKRGLPWLRRVKDCEEGDVLLIRRTNTRRLCFRVSVGQEMSLI